MGHESIAQAIEEILLEEGIETKLVKEKFKEIALQYQPVYQFFPKLNGKYYKLAQNESILKLMQNIYTKRKRQKLESLVRSFNPDVIINTHFLYNFPLAEIKPKYKFRFLNVVANPATLHPLEFTPEADYNLVYNEEAVKKAQEFDIPKEKILPIGWFTRKSFFTEKSTPQELPEIPEMLISAGSLGTNTIAKFLPVLFQHQDKFKYIFIAGKNKLLFRLFKNYERLCKLTRKKDTNIEIVGYTKKMPQYMKKADIIAGKAGPNLLFEAVAAGKPFLALTYISGQEDGNLDLIREKDLGWVALSPQEAQKVLENLTKDKEKLKRKEKSILKERQELIEAQKKLITLINP